MSVYWEASWKDTVRGQRFEQILSFEATKSIQGRNKHHSQQNYLWQDINKHSSGIIKRWKFQIVSILLKEHSWKKREINEQLCQFPMSAGTLIQKLKIYTFCSRKKKVYSCLGSDRQASTTKTSLRRSHQENGLLPYEILFLREVNRCGCCGFRRWRSFFSLLLLRSQFQRVKTWSFFFFDRNIIRSVAETQFSWI